MKVTRSLWIRATFHKHIPKEKRHGGPTHGVTATIFDEPTGIPYDNPYFVRLVDHFTNPDAAAAHAIVERPDIKLPDTKTFGYPLLNAHIYHTRNELVKRFLPVLQSSDPTVVKRGQSVGLIAERSYEFVVSLLALLSIGLRPALISSTATQYEIKKLMATAQAESLIIPQAREQTQQHPADEKTIVNTKWTVANRPISTTKAAQEFKTVIHKAYQGTILFTSGTTGKPKGVFTTTSSLCGQCQMLKAAWHYSPQDYILHALPLHHIHGLVNALLTPLSAGSSVEFIKQFHADQVLERIARPPSAEFPQITMFHGVPTMYTAFIAAYDAMPPSKQEFIAAGLRRLRVAVCGSAALPKPVAERWEAITGAIPLERYGMTETGMVLSNPVVPEQRVAGSVGWPLSNRRVVILDPQDRVIEFPGVPGQLAVHWSRSGLMFKGYWNNWQMCASSRVRPRQIEKTWVTGFKDGVLIQRPRPAGSTHSCSRHIAGDYFRTGDTAMMGDRGEYYILGRSDIDVIKVAGHLVSTLEVERQILALEQVAEVAVVGVPSLRFGQLPYAIVVLNPKHAAEFAAATTKDAARKFKNDFARDATRALRLVLSAEKLPRKWIIVDKIPRNAMGKVSKKELLRNRDLLPEADDEAAAETDRELVKKQAQKDARAKDFSVVAGNIKVAQ
ncbi:hypothetical protein DRE_04479 [Drechslerella stenobrocha 248]|uniref:AMP-dependent synthetase/ligase domain-containing protein n=1 Tax=Drechslerella stenobrocha 248 TaxID=1043628 RepID=W7I213_9PEZI|nr:hypothetical protein DRE_04479 [Drechslerella stenobrocha 248]